MLLVGEDTKPIESMTRPGFLECPYVYKEIGYNFEREIRLIFGINPDLLSQKPNLPGIVIELDFWKLLRSLPGARIEVSPETPEAERSAIATVFRSVQAEQEERQPEIQRHPEQQATASESPFTMSDEPQGLFPDLG